jgi:hypothetical protein
MNRQGCPWVSLRDLGINKKPAPHKGAGWYHMQLPSAYQLSGNASSVSGSSTASLRLARRASRLL